ncbi:hypothetical protein ANCDUO_14914 [Ancylostoma duodenale]|uniref:RNA-directed DNA polymerase n=1 Tax=Ancylostoma duodenale TaxID=51022 RepID=A0A0C2CYN5_9BILA|nr:hypothetical protein ANCDUO_14914 [Ancylostoma duodenale]
MRVDSDDTITQAIAPDLCKNIAKSKRFYEKPLRRLHSGLYDTVEYGEIMSFDGHHMTSNLGIMSGCDITEGKCTKNYGVIVWNPPTNGTRFCKYVKSTSALMYISTNHVVSEEIQAVFHFDNNNITAQQKQKLCIPASAEKMANGAFLHFPNLKISSRSNVREFLRNNASEVRALGESQHRESKTLRLTPYRSKRSITSLTNKGSNATDALLMLSNDEASPEARELAKHRFMNMFTETNNGHLKNSYDQNQYELNVRTQFLSYRLQEQISSNFRYLWAKICHITNVQTRMLSFIVKTDPSIVAKIMLDNDDVSALLAGQVLLITQCKAVIADEIIYSNKINGKCYAHTPKYNELVFNSAPIFHSELARLQKMISISSKAKSYDDSLHHPNKDHHPDFLDDQLNALAADGLSYATTLEENAKEVLQEGGTIILEAISSRIMFIIIFVIFCIVFIITLGACYYLSCIRIAFRLFCRLFQPKNQKRKQKSKNNSEHRMHTIDNGRIDNDSSHISNHNVQAEEMELQSGNPSYISATTKFLTYIPIALGFVGSVGANGNASPCFVPIFANEKSLTALFDTGSSITFTSDHVLTHVIEGALHYEDVPPAKAANGGNIPFLGSSKVTITIGKITKTHKILVTCSKHCPAPFVLGTDFLATLRIPIRMEFDRNRITIGSTTIPITQMSTSFENEIYAVKIFEDITIPPRSDNYVIAQINATFSDDDEVIAEDLGSDAMPDGIFVGKTLFCPGTTRKFPLRILNTSNSSIKLYCDQRIAKAEIIHKSRTRKVFSVHNDTYNDPKQDSCILAKNIRDQIDYIPPEVETESFPITYSYSNIASLDKICWNNSQLTLEQKSDIIQLVHEYHDIFLSSDGKIGRYNGPIRHRIDLINNANIPKQKPYRVPLEQRTEIARQIQELLDQRIIEKSSSPFCAPIILVRKKDATWRFVVDYRKLNSITKTETYLIPNVQEIIDLTAGKTYYTTVDFKSGFHQIPMKKSHRERTAFQTFLGLYQFITMPMGLKGAPDTFQKIANSLIRELKSCTFAYIDDIVTCSDDFAGHIVDIRELFDRIRSFGMKLRLDKCVFAAQEVEYLGVLISKNGSRINPIRTEKIANFPVPTNVTSVKSFLGMASYFRRFIRNFAEIASPLCQLTTKDHRKFQWRREHQSAFEELKKRLSSAPVLAAPIPGQPYEIHTDASTKAVAGTLLQTNPHNNEIHPIAFVSRCLTKHEKNYAIIELEALAIVFSLEKFRPYVFGAKIKVLTDHSPLRSLLYRTELNGRLAKYQIAIMGYDVTIEYRPGKQNTVSDALSRNPPLEKTVNTIVHSQLPTLDEVRAEQEKSPYFTRIQALRSEPEQIAENNDVTGNDGTEENTRIVENDEITRNGEAASRKRFCLHNDALFYFDGKNYRLVITNDEQKRKVIEHHHDHIIDGGHRGITKTLAKIRSRFYWKNMNDQIKTFVRNCVICQKVKSPPQYLNREKLGSFPSMNHPFQRVHSDVVGPLPMCINGNMYILIHTCAFTKYVICSAITDQQTKTIAKTFVNDVICRYGVPEILITDRGSNYTSELFKDIVEIIGVKHSLTTAYHHEANGQVERYVKTITDSLTCFVKDSRESWSDFLQLIVFAINTSQNETTGETPFFLMHGRDPKLISDNVFKMPRRTYFDHTSYKMELIHNLTVAWQNNEKRLKSKTEIYKTNYDKSRDTNASFLVGDLVLLRNDDNHPKFTERWQGPYRITRMETPNVSIQLVGDPSKNDTVHLNRVKQFQSRDTFPVMVIPDHTATEVLEEEPMAITAPQRPKRTCRLRQRAILNL